MSTETSESVVVEPVTSYFGITSRCPGFSAVPFGMLLASAITAAGTP